MRTGKAINDRLLGIDFTKGVLVLFMVLYHWCNYSFGPTSDFYKYLRFLTPSFIFITGFLVSHMYLPRFLRGESGVPKRVAVRALKLLALFVGLNLAIAMLVSRSAATTLAAPAFSLENFLSVYVAGNTLIEGHGKAAAFYILLPISYLLLLAAGLMPLCKRYRYVYHFTLLTFVACAVGMGMAGFASANLELVSVGLLGVLIGYMPIERINSIVDYWGVITLAYVGYTIYITFSKVGYTLQVVSVFLNVMLLYLVGTIAGDLWGLREKIALLGRYSLFGYISQIAILQILFRATRQVGTGAAVITAVLFAAILLTYASVAVLDHARGSGSSVDKLYRAVFS